MTIADHLSQLAAGQSASDLVAAACARAQADTLNAVVRVEHDRARAWATAIDQRLAAGADTNQLPLAGLPILVKDNICVKDQEVGACSRILNGFKPPYQADVIDRLLAAGAVPIGVTNMDEFAMGSSNETSCHGPVAHPSDAARIPGGSSGGSAAAVASGITAVALGSDTGGSIRQPAAMCGCVGFKPTYGRVSRYGLLAFASSLDQIGPLTANVADARALFQVLAGHDQRDSTSHPQAAAQPITNTKADDTLRGQRVGIMPGHREGLQPDILAALDRTIAVCEQAGAEIVTIELPHERYAVPIYYIVATGEASSNLSRYDGVHYGHRSDNPANLADLYAHSRGAGFGAEVKRRIMLGTYVLSAGYFDAYYKKAMQVRQLVCHDYAAAFKQCDFILGPTSPTTAFKQGEKTSDPLTMYLSDIFTIGANLAGLPAISIPAGNDHQGLPIGMHLQAPNFSDEALLDAAMVIEQGL